MQLAYRDLIRFNANPIKFFLGAKPEKKQTTEKIFRQLVELYASWPGSLQRKFAVVDTPTRTTAAWKSEATKAAAEGRLPVLQRECDTAADIVKALSDCGLKLVQVGPRVVLSENLFCETDETVCQLVETGETFVFRFVNSLGSPTEARRTVFQAGWDAAIAFNKCACPTLCNGIVLIEQESPNSAYLLTGEFLGQDSYYRPSTVADIQEQIQRLVSTEPVPEVVTLQRF